MEKIAREPDHSPTALHAGDTVLVFSRSASAWVTAEVVHIINEFLLRVEWKIGEDLFGKTMNTHSEYLVIQSTKAPSLSSLGECDPEVSVAAPRNDVEIDRSLGSFFQGAYQLGKTLQQINGCEYEFIEDQPPVYLHTRTGIKTWDMILDLRSGEKEEGEILWHYTNKCGFLNITNVYHEFTVLWASIKQQVADKDQPDTGFGEGVYASKREPAAWRCKEEILINNFCGVDQFAGKADYCVPLLVPRHAIQACTKMVFGKHMGMDTQAHFYKHIFSDELCTVCQQAQRTQSLLASIDKHDIKPFERDVWCIRMLNEEGHVSNVAVSMKETLTRRVQLLDLLSGPTHLDTLKACDRLAWCLNALDQKKDAEKYHRRVLEGRRSQLGVGNSDTHIAYGSLGLCLRWQRGKKDAEARRMLRTALEGLQKIMGAQAARTLDACHHYALCLDSDSCKAKAEALHRQAYTGCLNCTELGEEHPQTLTARGALGLCLCYQKKYTEATKLLRFNVECCERILGKTHPKTLASYYALSTCLFSQDAYSEAEHYDRVNFDGSERVRGKTHRLTVFACGRLAKCIFNQCRYHEALPLLQQFEDGLSHLEMDGGGVREDIQRVREDIQTCLEAIRRS